MRTTKNVGRTIGFLLIAQMATGGVVNAVLQAPITSPPGFLVNAAAHPLQIGLSVLIGLVAGALSAAVAIVALPVLRRYSYATAMWLLALGIVAATLTVMENSAVMSMLSFSQAYAQAGPSDAALFEALRVVAASSRNWAHFTHMLVGGATYLVFYVALYRFALIPRALAAVAAAAVALQIAAVSLPFLGYPVVPLMLAPMGIAHLAASVWLAVKGFATPAVHLDPLSQGEGSVRVSDV